MSLSYCHISSLHFHVGVAIIYDWHLQLVQFIFCCDRPWSALTGGCLCFIWFQEIQTLVYALIHFHLLLWIPLFFSSGGLLVHSKPTGSQLSILAIWHCACKKTKSNWRASLQDMRFRCVIGQYRVAHEVASSQSCRNQSNVRWIVEAQSALKLFPTYSMPLSIFGQIWETQDTHLLKWLFHFPFLLPNSLWGRKRRVGFCPTVSSCWPCQVSLLL